MNSVPFEYDAPVVIAIPWILIESAVIIIYIYIYIYTHTHGEKRRIVK